MDAGNPQRTVDCREMGSKDLENERAKAAPSTIPGGVATCRMDGGGVSDGLIGHVNVFKLNCTSYVPSLFFLPSYHCLRFRRTLIFNLN